MFAWIPSAAAHEADEAPPTERPQGQTREAWRLGPSGSRTTRCAPAHATCQRWQRRRDPERVQEGLERGRCGWWRQTRGAARPPCSASGRGLRHSAAVAHQRPSANGARPGSRATRRARVTRPVAQAAGRAVPGLWGRRDGVSLSHNTVVKALRRKREVRSVLDVPCCAPVALCTMQDLNSRTGTVGNS